MNEPLFEHDCDECRFIGSMAGKDFYLHLMPSGISDPLTTVVVRSSNEPSDYTSMQLWVILQESGWFPL